MVSLDFRDKGAGLIRQGHAWGWRGQAMIQGSVGQAPFTGGPGFALMFPMVFKPVTQTMRQPRPLDNQQSGGEQQQAGKLHGPRQPRNG